MRNRSWCKTRIKAFKYCTGGAIHLWNEQQDGIMGCVAEKIKINV
jgi:hypothetical protein